MIKSTRWFILLGLYRLFGTLIGKQFRDLVDLLEVEELWIMVVGILYHHRIWSILHLTLEPKPYNVHCQLNCPNE